MEQDRGIEYKSKIKEVKLLIEKVKKIEFNTEKIEQEIEAIEKSVNQQEDESYEKYVHLETNDGLLSYALIEAHTSAVSKLNKIINDLIIKYKEYHEIYYNALTLEKDLPKVNESNITSNIIEIKTLIKRMNETSEIDYELEEHIVEKVYQVAYKMLKLESIYTNETLLLHYIKQNEINISFICNYIEQDIEIVNSNKDKYPEEIYDKYIEIQTKGISNDLLLDKELIKLLTLVNTEDLIQIKKENFLTKYSKITSCGEEVKLLIERQQQITTDINDLKNQRKNLKRKKLKKKIILLINFASLSAVACGLKKVTEQLAVDITYKTTIETYDSSTGEPPKQEETYQKETKNETIITEYLPWVEPGYFRDEYTREIYTYDATNMDIDYDNILDYLTPEILEHGVTTNLDTEHKEEVPEEELYTENIYKIRKVVQDLDAVSSQPNHSKFMFWFLVELGILTVGDLVFLLFLSQIIPSNKKERKQVKEKLKAAKKLLLEHNQEFDKKLKEYESLKLSLLEEYDKLPAVIHNNPTVKKRIKELSANQNDNQK